jgi:hypothetical protein
MDDLLAGFGRRQSQQADAGAQQRGATAMSDLEYFALGLGLLVVYLAAMAAVLFGAGGTFAVPMFWAYLFLFAILCPAPPFLC